MNITELHNLVSEIAEELPEVEAKKLEEHRDSLEELGPNDWSAKIASFANDMLIENLGNQEKLMLLEAEAENSGSFEIKPIYILVLIIIFVLVVKFV
ncbi:hypothetical protein MO867_22030 [Microbulbifer sp. OS29]|uniref:Uncharacterized protein n=1 Tax=Microbulbifer okhotskensis TaxID=2926617 RepID=A0A9X2J9U4_9GAMM|nr:hypothetical protein [Microbulbifer okhotskensis]MCO1337006.1 hypothetical protein [Microbulbifer okhotskensis]